MKYSSDPLKVQVFNIDDKIVSNNRSLLSLEQMDIKFKTVRVGNKHVLALSTTGQLFGWGRNNQLQLGKIPEQIKA